MLCALVYPNFEERTKASSLALISFSFSGPFAFAVRSARGSLPGSRESNADARRLGNTLRRKRGRRYLLDITDIDFRQADLSQRHSYAPGLFPKGGQHGDIAWMDKRASSFSSDPLIGLSARQALDQAHDPGSFSRIFIHRPRRERNKGTIQGYGELARSRQTDCLNSQTAKRSFAFSVQLKTHYAMKRLLRSIPPCSRFLQRG